MSKLMLIDAGHAEETRVVVTDGRLVEDFDFETKARRQLRGNIYLAKVTRVEPSLQAAFIEYGGNRHGFLAFDEIHPDYYQIPVADREALMAEPETEEDRRDAEASGDEDDDELPAEEARLRRRLLRKYKIQEVIRRRQILLVQVVKEERGNKGAALTTYLSLAGRYGVLMPNTPRGGGISRKITSATARKRLKTIVQGLEVPKGMGLIVRTAGAERTKAEIKRDYEYLLRLWENIRETTLKSMAPALIYEEEDLVKRAIRDMFDKDTEVLVEGEAGYKEAREFMRMLMPSQAKKIQQWKEPTPLFVRYGVEDTLSQIYSPVVPLKSGGYIVINQTEALVAIDVNSGRSTKERNIESTAVKTNLEAADEAARQLRLRDLAGLIVIDFIDMEESKNNRAVEKRMKDALKDDRARIQTGKISGFGLMEISRQRRRTGILEGSTHVCEHCQGLGRVRSVESSALQAMRALEIEAVRNGPGAATLRLPAPVALYVLNEKREHLLRLHQESELFVTVLVDDSLTHAEFAVDRTEALEDYVAPVLKPLPMPTRSEEPDEIDEDEDEDADELAETGSEDRSGDRDRGERSGDRDSRRRRRRRRGGRRDELESREREAGEGPVDTDPLADDEDSSGDDSEESRRRRRRGRRGGRRARDEGRGRDVYAWVRPRTPSLDEPYVWFDPIAVQESRFAAERAERPERPERPERDRRPERAARPAESLGTLTEVAAETPVAELPAATVDLDATPAKPSRRRGRRSASAAETVAADAARVEAPLPAAEALAEPEAAPAKKPRASRRKQPVAVEAAENEAEVVAAAPVEPSEPPHVEPTATSATVLAFEAAPEPVVAPEPTPDPAEISTPPAQPKRGWWRKRG